MVDRDEQNLKKKVLSPNIFGKVGRLVHFVGRFGAVLALTVGVLFVIRTQSRKRASRRLPAVSVAVAGFPGQARE
jgi:hypothetical protein